MTVNIDPRHFGAVIFDLDGVVTDTASIHKRAWTTAFAQIVGGAQLSPHEYLRYLDGRNRLDGIAAFLAARGIALPVGSPDDVAGKPTHYGIANAKNELFRTEITAGRVPRFESTVELAQQLQASGMAIGLFSASRNAAGVLEAAGLASLFAVRVDGIVAAELGLAGKPAPDMLVETAHRLGIRPKRTAVVEDSIAGIEAARAGQFGLSIGIERDGVSLGADLTVRDAAEITVLSISGNPWTLAFDHYDREHQKLREALLGLGNGYLSTRAALPQAVNSDAHYPATYVSGVFNRLNDEVGGKTIANESLVKTPNWLPLTFQTGSDWFDIDNVTLLSYRQEFNLRRGVLTERFEYRDDSGHTIEVQNRRFVAMHAPHLCALEVTLTPKNFTGDIRIRTAIAHDVRNNLVERYRGLSDKHLERVRSDAPTDDVLAVETRTTQSHITIAVAVRTTVDRAANGTMRATLMVCSPARRQSMLPPASGCASGRLPQSTRAAIAQSASPSRQRWALSATAISIRFSPDTKCPGSICGPSSESTPADGTIVSAYCGFTCCNSFKRYRRTVTTSTPEYPHVSMVRPTAGTSSGMNCSSFRYSIFAIPRSLDPCCGTATAGSTRPDERPVQRATKEHSSPGSRAAMAVKRARLCT